MELNISVKKKTGQIPTTGEQNTCRIAHVASKSHAHTSNIGDVLPSITYFSTGRIKSSFTPGLFTDN